MKRPNRREEEELRLLANVLKAYDPKHIEAIRLHFIKGAPAGVGDAETDPTIVRLLKRHLNTTGTCGRTVRKVHNDYRGYLMGLKDRISERLWALIGPQVPGHLYLGGDPSKGFNSYRHRGV